MVVTTLCDDLKCQHQLQDSRLGQKQQDERSCASGELCMPEVLVCGQYLQHLDPAVNDLLLEEEEHSGKIFLQQWGAKVAAPNASCSLSSLYL